MDFKQTPGMTGELTHWQYDTFRVDWRDPLIEPAYVTFALNADGSDRPHQHARRLAAGGLQLRLPGPRAATGSRTLRRFDRSTRMIDRSTQ